MTVETDCTPFKSEFKLVTRDFRYMYNLRDNIRLSIEDQFDICIAFSAMDHVLISRFDCSLQSIALSLPVWLQAGRSRGVQFILGAVHVERSGCAQATGRQWCESLPHS